MDALLILRDTITANVVKVIDSCSYSSLYDFIQTSLLGWPFFLWLTIFLLATLVFWKLEERTGKQISITYPLLSPSENRLMLNLAMCEHLRWNAAHEMMGYVNNTDDKHDCNELTKKHNCLKSWQELDAESDSTGYDYKVYDFGVIETSFILEYDSTKT